MRSISFFPPGVGDPVNALSRVGVFGFRGEFIIRGEIQTTDFTDYTDFVVND